MPDLTAKISIRAEDKFSAPASRITGASAKLAAGLEASRRELLNLDRRDASIKKLQSLGKRLGTTGQAMDLARKRTARLGREIAAAKNPSDSLTRSFEAARRKSDTLRRSHREQRDQLRNLRNELRAAGIDTRKLGDAQRGIAADIERSTRTMERQGEAAGRVSRAQERLDQSMQRAARGALIAGELRTIGRGALRLATGPIERMRQVERSKGELASLGMSRTEVDAVAQRGRNLSRNIAGITTAGFTSAAYDVRSGISSLDATGVADITQQAALTARATRADLGQMTSLFATGFGQFKGALFEDLSDKEFGAVFSAQLSKAVEQFKTDGSKMQQAIQSMGSGLAESGVSMALQFASLGALQQKMTAGEAGTTMAALERSAAQAQARFADAGLGVRTLDERGNILAPDQLLQQMQREFGDEYTTQIGAQIQQAFGSEESVKFFKALWGQGQALRDSAAALDEAATQGERFTRAMAARRDDNADARLEKLQQRWDTIQERLGARLIPVLDRAIPVLESVADRVDAFAEAHPGLVSAIMGAVGGIGLLAVGLAPAITGVLSLAVAIDWLRKRSALGAGDLAARGVGAPRGIPPGGGRTGPGRIGDWIRNAGRGGVGGVAGRAVDTGKGVWRQSGKFLRGKGGLLGAGLGVIVIGDTLLDKKLSGRQKAANVTAEVGGIGGALAGAAAGAALGTLAGPIGTAVGGILGGILGGLTGGAAGRGLGSVFHDPDEPATDSPSAAGTDVSLSAALAPAGAPAPGQVNFHNQFNITQQPGEDAEAFARRVVDQLDQRQQQQLREAQYDAL